MNTVYSYWGLLSNICQLGGEIRDPERNIPRGIFLSIGGIAILYLAMQTALLGVLPWREAAKSDFVISAFMEHIYGARAAQGVTVMILWIAFASLFARACWVIHPRSLRRRTRWQFFRRVRPRASHEKIPSYILISVGRGGVRVQLIVQIS